MPKDTSNCIAPVITLTAASLRWWGFLALLWLLHAGVASAQAPASLSGKTVSLTITGNPTSYSIEFGASTFTLRENGSFAQSGTYIYNTLSGTQGRAVLNTTAPVEDAGNVDTLTLTFSTATSGTFVDDFVWNDSTTGSYSGTFTTSGGAVASPVITTQPRSKSVTAGGDVTLSVSATGSGTLTYQWFKDGVAVNGATAASLPLNGLTTAQAGRYHVEVSNAGDMTPSEGVLVVVLPAGGGTFPGSDDFSDNSRDMARWGATDFGSASLVEANGRLEFSTSTTNYITGSWGWHSGLAPYTQDWEARVTVNLPDLTFTSNSFAALGLYVINSADPGDRVSVELDAGVYPGSYRNFLSVIRVDDIVGLDREILTSSTTATLRARWVAATARLHLEYDSDGPANGESWTSLRIVDPAATWGMTSGSFGIGIGGDSENRIVNSSDGLWLDSFATSVTPLPDLAWLPTQSTRDEVPFQALGTVFAAPPGATNPVGLGLSASGTYRFGFFNRLPANPAAPTVAEADLTGSPLAAGTQLVLKFSKRTNDHVSFVAMTADAGVLSDVGYAVNPSGNELTVRARVVNPVASESNNPDTVGAAFGLLVQLAPTPTGPENFRGTVFVTDMLYHDVEPPGPGDAAQTSTNYIGQMVSLAAKGISASTATFHAFIPERLFAAGRSNGVDVTGENCLGYRTYLQLTGSSNGFFKLNSPTTSAFADANFDSDGDGSADAIWRYKIANSTWSRQVIGFGKAQNLGASGLTYNFTTLAGVAGSFGSIDGTGSAARFYYPNCVALDSSGNLYVGENGNGTIRKVTPGGSVTTLAGLAGSYGSTNGTGSAARFNGPNGLAVDSAGNVYVADYGNHTIRKVTPGGSVTTLAGLAGSEGSADGTGSAARFRYPYNVAVDSAGIVYVSDTLNHTVRKVMPDGTVSTLAGTAGGRGNADGMGSAARFDHPNGLAVDTQGNIYVADYLNHTIRKVTPGGAVSTLAGLAGSSGSTDGTGNAARFYYPYGVALDSAGNVFVADEGNQTIRKVTPGGSVTTLAGLAGSQGSTDGPGSATRFSLPHGVAVDGAGNVYVADYSNMTIRKGVPTTSEPPVITGQPQGVTLLLNQFTNFSVTATGSAPLAYQWFKSFGGAPVLLPAATNSYYSILPTSRYPSGSYFVVVTNIYGSVTSSPALLRVLVPQRMFPPERLGGGQFRLRFGDQDGGLAGADDLGAFEVYATTNVFNTNSWVRLTNGLSIVNGQVQIEDAGAPGLPRRFYRIIER
jgi:sugar lactone lactonase YvrE